MDAHVATLLHRFWGESADAITSQDDLIGLPLTQIVGLHKACRRPTPHWHQKPAVGIQWLSWYCGWSGFLDPPLAPVATAPETMPRLDCATVVLLLSLIHI